ncbi:AAA family ATPase [Rhizohabitans arisaemae]|uniref:AAA family ATPase n=1 Tax=Rhizohabitans arisaemae TaxID=2720610 RepID=UPI0024B15E0A|nr:AAA family ATPase [Rhizohabitans arisaemae]
MLTRLEVKGFKNLLDVKIDFGPFTCIAGANGTGKSNVFDAIEFLSYLADETLAEAAQRVRGASGSPGGDPRDLFWDGYRDGEHRISLTAEMIVPAEVEDDLGVIAKATATFLRYDLVLEFKSPPTGRGVGRLGLAHEELRAVKRGDIARHMRFPHSAENFRDTVVIGQGESDVFLTTESWEDLTFIHVHGDRGSHDQPPPRIAAGKARRTVLSSVTGADSHPTIVAARREMQSWRRLALEPSALRAPDGFAAPRSLGTDGRHLAATLFRMAVETDHDVGVQDEEAVYAQVADRLSDLSGVGVESLRVEPDPAREVLTLYLQERGGLRLPARALSEGTLRFLALCVLLEDPTVTGLICMEEPENGIHPANLPAMVELVRDLSVDATERPGATNPYRQVVINTHAPGVVQLCDPDDLLLAETRPQRAPDGRVVSALSLLPYRGSWRAKQGGPTFSKADVIPYLVAPPGAQLRLSSETEG